MLLEPYPPSIATTPCDASFSTAATAFAGDDSSSIVISLILCLPFLRLKTSVATVMPSSMPVPTRASAPDCGTSTPTANSSAYAIPAPGTSEPASANSAANAMRLIIMTAPPRCLSVLSKSGRRRAGVGQARLCLHPQPVLQDLAGGGHGQHREYDDFRGPLVGREMLRCKPRQVRYGRSAARRQLHECHHLLVAGHRPPDDGRLSDTGMRIEDALDLGRMHVEAGPDDEFPRAADDEKCAVRCLPRHVAGIEPPLRIHGPGGLFCIAIVAAHDVG